MLRSTEAFQEAVLLGSDFDGAAGLTNQPAPNGATVESAYEHAVETHMGQDALERYRENGGLRNRAPGEIVTELLGTTVSVEERNELTEAIVATKLEQFLDQVGKRGSGGDIWPRTTPGFMAAWLKIYEARREGRAIDTAFISSGHDEFIKRFLKVHDLPQADIMVTDDLMRPMMQRLPQELCVKPSPFLLSLAQKAWAERYRIDWADMNSERFRAARARTIYTGDDVAKDGQLATNAGVEFIHIDLKDSVEGWRKVSWWAISHAGEVSYV